MTTTPRNDGRRTDELRPISFTRKFTGAAPGSVLAQAGRTTVLCTASIENSLPPWKTPTDPALATGWLTAEYSMLPGSTSPRKRRERDKLDGRSTEIQRLIGRSLRTAIDFSRLGARTIAIDCDVLEADGGTRTLSITGGFVALCDAVLSLGDAGRGIITHSVAAVSVGLVDGQPLLDLNYVEDSRAEADVNIVMTGAGQFVEVQGTAERAAFSWDELQRQLELARAGIAELTSRQRAALAGDWSIVGSIPRLAQYLTPLSPS